MSFDSFDSSSCHLHHQKKADDDPASSWCCDVLCFQGKKKEAKKKDNNTDKKKGDKKTKKDSKITKALMPKKTSAIFWFFFGMLYPSEKSNMAMAFFTHRFLTKKHKKPPAITSATSNSHVEIAGRSAMAHSLNDGFYHY